MNKALIVSPYFAQLGGGERYMLSVARVLSELGYELTFAWDKKQEIQDLCKLLDIKIGNISLDPVIKSLYFSSNPLKMYFATQKYDLVVYLSDGSLPLLGAKKNFVHMQVPFHDVGGRSFKNTLKKHFLDAVIVNSKFTKSIVDHEYGINSQVVYPPVDIVPQKIKKEQIVLSVGRFEQSLNIKKHDIMINAFRELSPQLPDWRLILVGGSNDPSWIDALKEQAKGLPIELLVNSSHVDLHNLYSRATIYWHAAGYGVDETKNPELVEHFGITTAEAIGYGCVPLVIPSGGQREIVADEALHWQEIPELIKKTVEIATNGYDNMSVLDISPYSPAKFKESLQNLL